jgi:hypothetical protein
MKNKIMNKLAILKKEEASLQISIRLRGVTFQKTVVNKVTAMRT